MPTYEELDALEKRVMRSIKAQAKEIYDLRTKVAKLERELDVQRRWDDETEHGVGIPPKPIVDLKMPPAKEVPWKITWETTSIGGVISLLSTTVIAQTAFKAHEKAAANGAPEFSQCIFEEIEKKNENY